MPDTYSQLVYHVIFSTKDRAPLITDRLRDRLYDYVGGIVRGEDGTLIEIGGMDDHVHLLLGLRPSRALADVIRAVKGSSSKWVNELPDHDAFAWQVGYGAFTVSRSSIDAVARCIRRQPDHHRRRSFQEEVAALCAAHGIEVPGRPVE